MLLPVVTKMQSDKFTVPVKRDMMMNNSLSKNFLDIFLKGKKKINQLNLEQVAQYTAIFLQKKIEKF